LPLAPARFHQPITANLGGGMAAETGL